MQQHELRQPAGATHKRKRVGRGNSSGSGNYSGKGMKGQKARSGGGVKPFFEGGQLPLVRRMARKRGFRNPFRIDYEEVNLSALSRFGAGTEVTSQTLLDERIIRHTRKPLKILGTGDIAVALTIEATSFSKSAKEKIEAAGGSIRWLKGEPATEEETAAIEAAKPKARRAAKAAEAKAAATAAAAKDAPKKKGRGEAEAATETDDSAEKTGSSTAGEEAQDGAGS